MFQKWEYIAQVRPIAPEQWGDGRAVERYNVPVLARMLTRRNAKRASLTAGPLFVCAAGEPD